MNNIIIKYIYTYLNLGFIIINYYYYKSSSSSNTQIITNLNTIQ